MPARIPEEPQAKEPLDPESGKPQDVWEDYFRKRKPAPSIVSNLVLKLHNAHRHEHVIAVIEAALRNGQSQPWMYDVLALTMEIAGRPKPEVERVLLSKIDFTAADVPSMIYSAAYLTRFDREGRALQLYQQASQLEPTRPEPYVMGLKLARRTKDYKAVAWAAPGVLSYAWTKDHEQLHRQAEDAAREAIEALQKQGDDEAAEELKQAMREARQRDLILKLTWAGNGDLDLVVEEPLGTICSLKTPRTRSGGILTRDGFGPKAENCFEEYVCAFAVPGDYRVTIRHIAGNIVGKRAVLAIIRRAGSSKETVEKRAVVLDGIDTIVPVPLEHGRREKLAAHAPPRGRALQAELPRKETGSLLQKVGPLDAEAREAGLRFQLARPQPVGVAPVVGPGAVGYQPIIAILSEGATLSAMAVISADRRYVRLSLSPVFSTLTDVFTFSFQSAGGGTPAGGGN